MGVRLAFVLCVSGLFRVAVSYAALNPQLSYLCLDKTVQPCQAHYSGHSNTLLSNLHLFGWNEAQWMVSFSLFNM